ncbi:glyoxalase-like domain-containing protein [Ephemerocybe angulata]|uniref:Glyoxalase-like domain-containing protein n=1 Tax=Ephemerocybe angulata TaxID=980116 RepID=A0A8H6M7F3_9AGAR|nr:glyoxalase-like domain-containing protein [Tulosesus angulatus]
MSSSGVNTRTIDHIVHLTPPGTVNEVSERFRKLGFKVLPGGTHADGLTENALVVLRDGTYLELISFTHPISYYPENTPERSKREGHRWANSAPGWIDYAFLGNGSLEEGHLISEIINDRAAVEGSGVKYLREVGGGRVRPDGEVLKWVISAPASGRNEIGSLPFFCGDVTPRSLRVQTEPPSNIEHPSTAFGLAYLDLLVSPACFEDTKKRLTSVLGSSPSPGDTDQTAFWDLEFVADLPPRIYPRPLLSLGVPSNDAQAKFLAETQGESGVGIYEVSFYVEHLDVGYPEEAETPDGRIRFIKI